MFTELECPGQQGLARTTQFRQTYWANGHHQKDRLEERVCYSALYCKYSYGLGSGRKSMTCSKIIHKRQKNRTQVAPLTHQAALLCQAGAGAKRLPRVLGTPPWRASAAAWAWGWAPCLSWGLDPRGAFLPTSTSL